MKFGKTGLEFGRARTLEGSSGGVSDPKVALATGNCVYETGARLFVVRVVKPIGCVRCTISSRPSGCRGIQVRS